MVVCVVRGRWLVDVNVVAKSSVWDICLLISCMDWREGREREIGRWRRERERERERECVCVFEGWRRDARGKEGGRREGSVVQLVLEMMVGGSLRKKVTQKFCLEICTKFLNFCAQGGCGDRPSPRPLECVVA